MSAPGAKQGDVVLLGLRKLSALLATRGFNVMRTTDPKKPSSDAPRMRTSHPRWVWLLAVLALAVGGVMVATWYVGPDSEPEWDGTIRCYLRTESSSSAEPSGALESPAPSAKGIR
jgi:hypothetical protein